MPGEDGARAQLAVLGAALRVEAVARLVLVHALAGDPDLVAGLADRLTQRGQRCARDRDRGLLGGEVHAGRLDARDGHECALDAADAGGAGHAAHGEPQLLEGDGGGLVGGHTKMLAR